MINHPNRSKRQARVRIVLANKGGVPLDERVVSVHRDESDGEIIAHETARAAAALILATEFLYPGDTITMTEITH
jgi:hypothetical protein